MKDPLDPDVLRSDTEAVEAPVLTSAVPPGTAAAAALLIETIVIDAFETHAGRIKAFAFAAVREDAVADDLVQETFLRFVRQVRTHDVPDNVGGWLYRVCANLIVSRGRRRNVAGRFRGLLVDRSTASSPEEQVLRTDEHARMRAVLADMPADARVALLMAAEGFTSAEIGAAIGRSAGATATYICRARVRVRERLLTSEGGS